MFTQDDDGNMASSVLAFDSMMRSGAQVTNYFFLKTFFKTQNMYVPMTFFEHFFNF